LVTITVVGCPSPNPHPARLTTVDALATGQGTPGDSVIATFIGNLPRLRDGRPLLALIDKQKGY
jgi:hypothetical protein